MRPKRPPQENREKQVNFRMKEEDFKKLETYAVKTDKTVADVIRTAIACEIGLSII
jgi:predicted DNA-binding protein